jgi:hypothetical protein
MDEELHCAVRRLYLKGDSTAMFGAILSIASERLRGDAGAVVPGGGARSAFDGALECLERCVTEKRLSWLAENERTLARTGNPLLDGFRAFYESYLGLSIPADGRIVSSDDTRIVSRWWNRCPALEACVATGLDTRVICRKVYETPVRAFLSRVDPRLKFRRNYDALRPHAPYCEEIIEM